MEDPLRELPTIVHSLTTSTPSAQASTLQRYFLPSASFSHPLVLLEPFLHPFPSRNALLAIYRFYKFLSPHVDLSITSIALDASPRGAKKREGKGEAEGEAGAESGAERGRSKPLKREREMIAYVQCEQVFRFWFWPFWPVVVELVAVLTLVEREEGGGGSRRGEAEKRRRLWYIKQQKDLYQVDQALAYLPFLLPGVPGLVRVVRRAGALCTVLLVWGLSLIASVFRSAFGFRVGGEHSPVEIKGSQQQRRRSEDEGGLPTDWLQTEHIFGDSIRPPVINLKGSARAEGGIEIL